MGNMNKLIARAKKTKHGFKDIQKLAIEVIDNNNFENAIQIAEELYTSDAHQVRCLAVFIFGHLAENSNKILNILKTVVSKDTDWRVQEILAKAFDMYCSNIGYKKAFPIIQEWLTESNPKVRRSVTEGLRIWTNRPFFDENPIIAIQLLSQFRNDESEYLRKSVGNALRDISKKHSELIDAELKTWDLSDKKIKLTYRLASKFLHNRLKY